MEGLLSAVHFERWKGCPPEHLKGEPRGQTCVGGKHTLAGVRDGLQGEGGRGEALAVSGRQGRPKGRSRRARCRERQPRDSRVVRGAGGYCELVVRRRTVHLPY